jgi:hypothetical protein
LTERIGEAGASQVLAEVDRMRLRTQLMNAPSGGATTLRTVRARSRWVWAVPVAAAAALLLYFVVVPGIDRQTTVSAAEILGRSQAALSAPKSGYELFIYDLEVGGAIGDLLPAEQAGRFDVYESVDHDHPGRYKIVKMGADGHIVAGAADDTLRGIRTRYMRVDGRGFLLRFTNAAPTALSIVALKKGVMQIFIGLMQASGDQTMRELDRGGEHCYEISIPGVTVATASLVSLDRARAVITADDSRLVEFSAAGTLSGQAFTIDFVQRFHAWNGTGTDDFDIPPQPGDTVMEGDATANPLWDVLTRVLEAVPASPPGSSK